MRNFKSRRGILQYRGILVLLVQQVELGLGTSKLHPEDFIFDSRPDIEEWNLDQKKEQRIEVPVRVNSFALLVKKII